MSDNYHREARTIFTLGVIVLPLLVLGLFMYRLHVQKTARLSQSEQLPKLAAEKSVLTSPLGRIGWPSIFIFLRCDHAG